MTRLPAPPTFHTLELEAMPGFAASLLAEAAAEAVARDGMFTLALSGGNSPKPLLRLLREQPELLPWDKTRVFFVDERCVPQDHPLSNFGMIHNELLAHVPVASVYRMRGENDPALEAERYARELEDYAPRGLHCAVLGMGADGHTASLFPHSAALEATDAVTFIERPDAVRITLSYPVLNAVDLALFYVAGADKAPKIQELLFEKPAPEAFPAAYIRAPRQVWVLEACLRPAIPTDCQRTTEE